MAETFQLPHTPIESFTLANGLRVILSVDHAIPVVSVAVYYDTGSRNEKVGRTGFAHLFEHMMFQGSENVPKAAHFQWISNAGGTMNGTTSSERTNYFETLPASQLPLALWLESDRMLSLKVTQENLDNQRSAVKEEKRLRIDNQPYVPGFLLADECIFTNHANAHSTIGSMEDLDAATVEDCQEFFRIYYAPNNAVLSIVGDFDVNEARTLVERYFASIPSQPPPPPVDVREPVEVAVRQQVYNDRFAPLPGFIIGWKVPPRRTRDSYALSLALDILVEGDSSRLYQELVKEKESVVQIQGGIDERRGPSAAFVFALPKPGNTPEQIRDSIMDEIKRLAEDGPTDEEMLKLRNNLSNDAVRGRQSSMYRAQRLAEYALYDGDPELFNSELGIYLSVSATEIREASAKYLNTDNKAILDIIPAAEDAGEPAPSDPEQPGEPTQPGAPPPQIPVPSESQTEAAPIKAAPLAPGGRIDLPSVEVPVD